MTGLPGYGLFAAMLAAAGLPIYLHAPAFYAAEYGLGLTALATVLFGLRLLDVVQDPALGWLSARLAAHRGLAVGVAVLILTSSMLGLFAIAPPIAPLAWFAVMLTLLFSSYSFLTITFYARGVSKAAAVGTNGHLRLAAWRETGALIGVSAAAVAPTVLVTSASPYAAFAFGFGALGLLAWAAMRAEWRAIGQSQSTGLAEFVVIVVDPVARRLLIIGLANAAPIAVSSSLFLFFVNDVLVAPAWAGALLLLFFVTAAFGAPFWTKVAARIGTRNALSIAMALSLAAFAPVPLLAIGDVLVFALICIVSGFAVGADVTLVPALFSRRMEIIAPSGAAGFGLWSFVTKFALALAAIMLLPALDAAGFVAGGASPPEALRLLSFLYAGLPCVLKLVALTLLWLGPLENTTQEA
ncbi:MAG: MFS transporter [Pseudomonadota bacterium]